MMESSIGESYVNKSLKDLKVIGDLHDGCGFGIGSSMSVFVEYICCMVVISSGDMILSRG